MPLAEDIEFDIILPNITFDSIEDAREYCNTQYSGLACSYTAYILNKM